MEILIAVDLEGIHGVVGEPYKTLTQSFDYPLACEGAVYEINAVAEELFKGGATRVCIWDNHGGGRNLDFSKIDPRCEQIDPKVDEFRFDFVKKYSFSYVIFLGYHAAEGAPLGVLAHTYSSTGIQYLSLSGESVGELTVDTLICDCHGIRPLLVAADDIAIKEMQVCYPDIYSVVTKYGEGRNKARLRSREEVLSDLRRAVKNALKHGSGKREHDYPTPSRLVVRYTRAERAQEIYEKCKQKNLAPVTHGPDTHILEFKIFAAKVIPAVI